MRKHYPWLWFDADGTLFDYDHAEGIALQKTFQSLNLLFKDGDLNIYRQINQQLWQALERQEITSATLRVRRFEMLLKALQLSGSPEELSLVYVEQLALCTELIEGAHDVLQSLQGRCQFAILTNGLQAVQQSRLAHSSIRNYITAMIISEEVGVAKPHPDFFAEALARTGSPAKSDILMIGDSLTSDMQGGINYGIDTCWYNPSAGSQINTLQITYEIKHLRDLLEILD